MANTIEENAQIILSALAGQKKEGGFEPTLSAEDIQRETGLEPGELNDAVTILVEGGLAEWLQYIGTAPYIFGETQITARGRYEVERMQAHVGSADRRASDGVLPPSPVGSPYGFTDKDWEMVAERKDDTHHLHVVLGCQFKSEHYDMGQMKCNVEKMFADALAKYARSPGAHTVELVFRPLAAGYGEHLFNEIARDIISSDIAVFETSDLNPNVMLELGVALTWGVRVLPIKKSGRPKPPSDVSGQTWADHTNSAAEFADPEHFEKLFRMVERAIRKKGHRVASNYSL